MCDVNVNVNQIHFIIGILLTPLFYKDACCYEYAKLNQAVCMLLVYCMPSLCYFDMGSHTGLSSLGYLMLRFTMSKIQLHLPLKICSSAAI